MKIRIIKSLLSIYGVMVSGMVTTVPEHIALNWIKNGIAEPEGDASKAKAKAKTEGAPEAELKKPQKRPSVIPKGMFWCGHCKSLHRAGSKIGQRHLKYSE